MEVPFTLEEVELKSLQALSPDISGAIYFQENPEKPNTFIPNKKFRVYSEFDWKDINLNKQYVVFTKGSKEKHLFPPPEIMFKIMKAMIEKNVFDYLVINEFGVFVINLTNPDAAQGMYNISNVKNVSEKNYKDFNTFITAKITTINKFNMAINEEFMKNFIDAFRFSFALFKPKLEFIPWSSMKASKFNSLGLKVMYYPSAELNVS